MSNRLIERSPPSQNHPTRKRTCKVCGKPLGSTDGACHDCGGDTYRGVRHTSPSLPTAAGLGSAARALGALFDRRMDEDEASQTEADDA